MKLRGLGGASIVNNAFQIEFPQYGQAVAKATACFCTTCETQRFPAASEGKNCLCRRFAR